eukprot:CAMPEP_0197063000 /NCGR_PEP_ID=MMETSP1384-20130603/149597_1 /TAXON_ID=29189 /ORGANISM="Ammonia sp." /LENGTH=76 /DNA_ID=CAMNT_0042499131 /DNA_START=1 /DNA_END=227 /DNA_ORIENTATION=-
MLMDEAKSGNVAKKHLRNLDLMITAANLRFGNKYLADTKSLRFLKHNRTLLESNEANDIHCVSIETLTSTHHTNNR